MISGTTVAIVMKLPEHGIKVVKSVLKKRFHGIVTDTTVSNPVMPRKLRIARFTYTL